MPSPNVNCSSTERLHNGGLVYVKYEVRFVSDDALPSEVEFAFVRWAGGVYLFVKRTAIDLATGRCDVLARAWKAWQKAEAERVLPGLLVGV